MFLSLPWCATAQEIAAPRPLEGERVRVHLQASASMLEGTVHRQTSDSIGIRLADRPGRDTVLSYRDLRSIDASFRQRTMWAPLAGAVVGLGAGIGLGLAAMRHGEAHCRQQPGNHDMCGLDLFTVPIYSIGGTVVGFVGGLFLKFDHWETVWTAEP